MYVITYSGRKEKATLMTYTLFQGHCDVKMKTVFACSDQLEFRLCMLHAQT